MDEVSGDGWSADYVAGDCAVVGTDVDVAAVVDVSDCAECGSECGAGVGCFGVDV